jgi:Xaa-Pro aminopeptidase
MFDFIGRRASVLQQMDKQQVDLLFLPISADLEYLTGLPRREPSFGNISYRHGWIAGGFFSAGREPLIILPRMISEFELEAQTALEMVIVSETDDGAAVLSEAAKRWPKVNRLGIGARTWGETVIELEKAFPDAALSNADDLINPLRRIKSVEELESMTRAATIVDEVMAAIGPKVRSGITEIELAAEINLEMKRRGSRVESFDTGVISIGKGDLRDAGTRISSKAIRPGMSVSFDFGAVVHGYCSDFGRTVFVGEPDDEFVRVYDLVIQAQAAGIAAARPGVTASAVDRAARDVIEAGGYAKWFRHRTGHCIGLDVHEYPFISVEDETVLEPGMTFTIEPSVFWPGHVGARIEDVVVCDASGSRKLNRYPEVLIVNP